MVTRSAAKARYEFFTIHENEMTLAGHTIQLTDRIADLIDGKDFSIKSEVIIRPKFRDSNRYF
jgi:hypothetical protein